MVRKLLVGASIAAVLFAAVGCSSSTSDADLGLERALEACTQESLNDGEIESIAVLAEQAGKMAALAAEAAVLDPRWRTLADHASAVKAGVDFLQRLDQGDGGTDEQNVERLQQALEDGSKFETECEAVKALASGN